MIDVCPYVYILETRKQFTIKLKKGDVGMVKCFSDKRDEFSTTCNPKSKLSQDACQFSGQITISNSCSRLLVEFID